MKTLSEIREVIAESKMMGPALRISAEDLLKHYDALRTAFIAETDGQDPDQAERRFLK